MCERKGEVEQRIGLIELVVELVWLNGHVARRADGGPQRSGCRDYDRQPMMEAKGSLPGVIFA